MNNLFEQMAQDLNPNRAMKDLQEICNLQPTVEYQDNRIIKSSGKVLTDRQLLEIENLRSQFDPEPKDFQG